MFDGDALVIAQTDGRTTAASHLRPSQRRENQQNPRVKEGEEEKKPLLLPDHGFHSNHSSIAVQSSQSVQGF